MPFQLLFGAGKCPYKVEEDQWVSNPIGVESRRRTTILVFRPANKLKKPLNRPDEG